MKLLGINALLVLLSMMSFTPIFGQAVPPQLKMPSGQSLSRAHKMAEQLFENLKAGKSQEIAQWITDEVGYAWDATTKIQKMNDFKAKLDIIAVRPPASSFGKQ